MKGAMFHKGICILFAFALIVGVLLVGSGETMAQQTNPEGDTTMEAVRIVQQDAYQQVTLGKALLVCAYQNEQSCSKIMLKGGISLQEFERKLPELKRDQPIIFFCQ